jgi:hypothetical protein
MHQVLGRLIQELVPYFRLGAIGQVSLTALCLSYGGGAWFSTGRDPQFAQLPNHRGMASGATEWRIPGIFDLFCQAVSHIFPGYDVIYSRTLPIMKKCGA